MSDTVRSSELLDALSTFRSYTDDLARADFAACSTKLRLVINFSQRDRVGRALAERLLARFPASEVVERVQAERYEPPSDPADRLALSYATLHQIKTGHKLELRQLLSQGSFSGSGMDGRWGAFVEAVVRPVVTGLDALHGWIAGQPAQEELDAEAFFQAALAAYSATAPAAEAASASGEPGDAAPAGAAGTSTPPSRQPTAGGGPPAAGAGPTEDTPREPRAASAPPVVAPPPEAPPTQSLVDLQERIRAAPLPESGREDLLVDSRILALELAKDRPDPERLAELMVPLTRIDQRLLAPALAALLERGR